MLLSKLHNHVNVLPGLNSTIEYTTAYCHYPVNFVIASCCWYKGFRGCKWYNDVDGCNGGGVSDDEKAEDECEEATLPDSSQFLNVNEPLVDGVGEVGEDPIKTRELLLIIGFVCSSLESSSNPSISLSESFTASEVGIIGSRSVSPSNAARLPASSPSSGDLLLPLLPLIWCGALPS